VANAESTQHSSRHALLIFAVTGLFVCLSSPALGQAVSEEYQIKAAYLKKIPSFVQWPEGQIKMAKLPFRLCVLGELQPEIESRLMEVHL
jgi:hypothetical protein